MIDTFLAISFVHWNPAFRTLPPALMLGHTMSYQMISHPDEIRNNLMIPEALVTTTNATTMAEDVSHTISQPNIRSSNDVLEHRSDHYHRYEHPLSSSITENVFINQLITGMERWARIGTRTFPSLIPIH